MSSRRRYLYVLDISKLIEVIDALNRYNFPEGKWLILGLRLGLLHPKLKAIEDNNRRDVARCLLECLSLWLTTATARSRTWDRIADALDRIDETEAAENVRKTLADPASQLLQRYSDRLSQVVLPEASVQLLHTEGVISKETVAEVESCGGLLHVASLVAVCTTVAADHNKLRVLATVLSRFDETQSLAKKLLDDCDQVILDDTVLATTATAEATASQSSEALLSVDQITHTPTLSDEEFRVSEEHNRRFELMRGRFCKFCSNVSKILTQKISLEEIKSYAMRYCREQKQEIANATSVEKVMNIIEESKCNIINIAAIEVIVDLYDATEAKELIANYNKEVDNFCSEMKLRFMLDTNLLPRTLLRCETIKFVLDWSPDEQSLNDIRCLLEKAFKHLKKNVIVQSFRTTNSILIICYAPHHLMDALLLEVQTNLAVLQKEEELIQLTIGHYTVYDRNIRDKELISLKDEYQLAQEEIRKLTELKNKEDEIIPDVKDDPGLGEKQMMKSNDDEGKLLENENEQSKESPDTVLKKELLAKEKVIQAMAAEIDQLQSSLKLTKAGLAENKVEEIELLQDKISIQSVQLLDKEKERQQLQKHFQTYEQLLKEEKVKMAEKEKMLQSAKSEVQQISEKFTAQIDQLKATVEHNEKLESQIKEKDKELTSQSKEMTSVRKDMERISRENETLVKKTKSCAPTLHDDWKDPHTPPVQIVMTSFSDYKKSNENWYSPCFFSHEGGYKMCLRIKANGADSGQGTHVSVYVHLMAGENDDYLPWPFEGVVKLEALNRRSNRNHFTNEIKFDDTTNQEARQRVFNGIATKSGTMAFMGQGGVQFMSQDKLPYNAQEGTEYLRDDSIKIRITSVKVIEPVVVTIPSVPKTDFQSVAEFKINDFSKNKSSNAECISEPFYSHVNGYKFALLVYPNGRGSYKGQSVSAFVHLMKGENDDRLKFPFRGEILTQIVNTREDKNHVEKIISFDDETDPDGKYGARVAGITTWFSSGRSFQGYGFRDFLPHDLLMFDENHDNTQYLSDDDSLTVRVIKIKVNSM